MSYWKKLYAKQLIITAHAVNYNLKNNNVHKLIKIPKTFHSEKQMMDFSNEINNSIMFPHFRYLAK